MRSGGEIGVPAEGFPAADEGTDGQAGSGQQQCRSGPGRAGQGVHDGDGQAEHVSERAGRRRGQHRAGDRAEHPRHPTGQHGLAEQDPAQFGPSGTEDPQHGELADPCPRAVRGPDDTQREGAERQDRHPDAHREIRRTEQTGQIADPVGDRVGRKPLVLKGLGDRGEGVPADVEVAQAGQVAQVGREFGQGVVVEVEEGDGFGEGAEFVGYRGAAVVAGVEGGQAVEVTDLGREVGESVVREDEDLEFRASPDRLGYFSQLLAPWVHQYVGRGLLSPGYVGVSGRSRPCSLIGHRTPPTGPARRRVADVPPHRR